MIQVLKDNAALPVGGERAAFELLHVDTEEKVKIWGMYDLPYRLLCFYRLECLRKDSALERTRAPKPKEFDLKSEETS